MEFFLLYLDDLDDLYGAIGLIWEDVRNGIVLVLSALLVVIAAAAAFFLAWSYPLLAPGISSFLFVAFIYRSVTAPALKFRA